MGRSDAGRISQRPAFRSILERTKREATAEADCICFPPGKPPHLELRPEIEAAGAVRCPLHGEGFKRRAPTVYRVIGVPAHLDRASWRWRSAQSIKAMDASFPPRPLAGEEDRGTGWDGAVCAEGWDGDSSAATP